MLVKMISGDSILPIKNENYKLMKEMFKKVASFQYSSEALILKGRLESEGIEVFMMDMHTIDTDPLVSNAIGGVKVRVRVEDEERALQIIDSIHKYTINEEGYLLKCPKCNAEKIIMITAIDSIKGLLMFLFGFLLFLLPTYQKMKYQCQECGEKFNVK